MKQLIESVQRACVLIAEGKQATGKFKAGDRVGVGHTRNSVSVEPLDTGTVTNVDKAGTHTVELDTHKSRDDNTKPMKIRYDNIGREVNVGSTHIYPIKDHERIVANRKESRERFSDMGNITSHIESLKVGYGTDYKKFDKMHADNLKALIDKHTHQE